MLSDCNTSIDDQVTSKSFEFVSAWMNAWLNLLILS